MADEQTVATGRRVCVKCQKEMRDTEFYNIKMDIKQICVKNA